MAVQIGMSVGESKLMMSIKISNVPLTLGIPRVGTKCVQDGSLGPVRTGWLVVQPGVWGGGDPPRVGMGKKARASGTRH